MKKILQRLIQILTMIGACFIFLVNFHSTERKPDIQFTEVKSDFPGLQKNLRKWDAPVVADLDQDGYLDLILNDHGLGISIRWNNKGKFAKPYDLIMGDLHGVSVGDFDLDGNQELILSRGGGSGGNARNSKIYRVSRQREFTALPDFDTPLELMRGRTVKFTDGDNDGDLDLLNFAFPDKEKKGASENYIYQNNGDGQLVLLSSLPAIETDGQKTLLTDFNGDAVADIILYGKGRVRAFQGKGDLYYQEVTDEVFPFDITGVSGIVEFDYDNDGDFDLFFTRGEEFEVGETFFDESTKTFGFFTKRGAFQFEDIEIGDVLNIENFQSQWPHNDAYYIGETGYDYEFAGETHSGKDIRLVSSNALGFPDQLKETGGIHIGYVGNQKWRIAGDMWSPFTGVVHNVNNYPESNHPKGLQDLLLENNLNGFTEVTKEANLYYEEHTTGVAVADFDNNGFQHLLITRRGDLIHENQACIYLNEDGTAFRKLNHHNVVSKELGAIGMGVEAFDYNNDGAMDIILGNERGKWHLYRNMLPPVTEQAQYLTIQVGNSASGKATALAALVSIEACGNKQVKRVGATGAAYSLSFNNLVHFGVGSCNEPIQVSVRWTNGETKKREVAIANNTVLIGEI